MTELSWFQLTQKNPARQLLAGHSQWPALQMVFRWYLVHTFITLCCPDLWVQVCIFSLSLLFNQWWRWCSLSPLMHQSCSTSVWFLLLRNYTAITDWAHTQWFPNSDINKLITHPSTGQTPRQCTTIANVNANECKCIQCKPTHTSWTVGGQKGATVGRKMYCPSTRWLGFSLTIILTAEVSSALRGVFLQLRLTFDLPVDVASNKKELLFGGNSIIFDSVIDLCCLF